MAKERTERHVDISAFVTAFQSPDSTQTKKSKEQWLEQAHTYQKARQYAKAIIAIDHAIHIDPTYVEAGRCFLQPWTVSGSSSRV